MTDVQLPESFAAQVAEALPVDPRTEIAAKPQTKTVMWHGRAWQIRHRPGAKFLAAYEQERLMEAAEMVLGEKQYRDLYDLDVDIEGDEGLEGFFEACNRAWGIPGN